MRSRRMPSSAGSRYGSLTFYREGHDRSYPFLLPLSPVLSDATPRLGKRARFLVLRFLLSHHSESGAHQDESTRYARSVPADRFIHSAFQKKKSGTGYAAPPSFPPTLSPLRAPSLPHAGPHSSTVSVEGAGVHTSGTCPCPPDRVDGTVSPIWEESFIQLRRRSLSRGCASPAPADRQVQMSQLS